MVRMLVAIAIVVGSFTSRRGGAGPTATPAPAEVARSVALLPLDADAKLELFGQPVASEVARALVQGGLDVVVVGPQMAVPAKARIIVDGTIKAGKAGKAGNAGKAGKAGKIELTVRLRDAREGGVLDTVSVEAEITTMDRAAEELSAEVLPSVRAHLATLIDKDAQPLPAKHGDEPRREPVPGPAPLLAAVVARADAGPDPQRLRGALEAALAPWAARRHHAPRGVDLHPFTDAPKAVIGAHAEVAIELEVLALAIEPGVVPMARARVRIRIADPQAVVFDRVIVTDTIVGDKGLDPAKLVERAAREVLAIADPQLRRRIPAWY